VKQADDGTWIDEDGQFADPGTEFIFDPRKQSDASPNNSTAPTDSDTGSDDVEEESEVQASLSGPTASDEDTADSEGFLMKDGEVV